MRGGASGRTYRQAYWEPLLGRPLLDSLVQHDVHKGVKAAQHAGDLAVAVELQQQALVHVLFQVWHIHPRTHSVQTLVPDELESSEGRSSCQEGGNKLVFTRPLSRIRRG